MAYDKTISITSPRGIARFPKLVKYDEYQGKKFFCVDLIVDPEDAQTKALVAAVEKVSADYYAKLLANAKTPAARKKLETFRMGLPYLPETDRETGEETGKLVLKFKTHAFHKDKEGNEKPNIVRMFDAFGRPCKVDPWGGTEMKVACELFPYDNAASEKYGVSLRIKAVQIITLRTGNGGDASEFGFEAVEDGFSVDSATSADAAAPEGDQKGSSGNGDF